MTHLLDNQCRIIDVDGEVTLWGHVGIDPDPARDEYYRKVYASRLRRDNAADETWRPPLRAASSTDATGSVAPILPGVVACKTRFAGCSM